MLVIPRGKLGRAEHLVRRDNAELRVAGDAFDPEIIRVADWFRTPFGFERPLAIINRAGQPVCFSSAAAIPATSFNR